MTVVLTFEAVKALNHCLSATDAKGRSELRDHSRVQRELKAKCLSERALPGGDVEMRVNLDGGTLTLDEDRFKFLKRIVDKKIESSVPGGLSVGYDDLVEAIENAKKEETSHA